MTALSKFSLVLVRRHSALAIPLIIMLNQILKDPEFLSRAASHFLAILIAWFLPGRVPNTASERGESRLVGAAFTISFWCDRYGIWRCSKWTVGRDELVGTAVPMS